MSQLKNIAMFFMLIDHLAYVMIERGIGLSGNWYLIDRIMRGMGRLAFPIFCFTIVEGFQRTHDVRAYRNRLLKFALISEIPFDLAFRGTPVSLNYQNVFWTLAFGMELLILYEDRWMPAWKRGMGIVLCVFLPTILHTDYSCYGVMAIFFMYLLRSQPVFMCLAGYTVLLLQSTQEVWAVVGFLLILMYNGQRGYGNKKFYYWFYPVHLLLLVWAKPYILSLFSSFLATSVLI